MAKKKLRKLAEENIDAGWVIVNGNRIQIKRKQFEKNHRYIGRNLMSLSRRYGIIRYSVSRLIHDGKELYTMSNVKTKRQ